MNIKDYLKGKIDYTVGDDKILVILEDRAISADADTSTLAVEQKELAYADLLMFLATVFGGSGKTVKRGNWTDSERGLTIGITDRYELKKQANIIYAKYGEKKYSMKDGTNLW